MKIYHVKNPTFGIGFPPPKFPDEYEMVAEIKIDSVNAAFYKTQNIYESWVKDNCVKTSIRSNIRSTSIGDVIEDNNGLYWRVQPVGFEQVSLNKATDEK